MIRNLKITISLGLSITTICSWTISISANMWMFLCKYFTEHLPHHLKKVKAKLIGFFSPTGVKLCHVHKTYLHTKFSLDLSHHISHSAYCTEWHHSCSTNLLCPFHRGATKDQNESVNLAVVDARCMLQEVALFTFRERLSMTTIL